jgi:transcription antitermination factor NusG
MLDEGACLLPEQSWYVVAVEPQTERMVKARSDDLQVESFYPISRKLVFRRKGREVERPAMPGYVFVRIGADRFASFGRHLERADGVDHCLGFLGDEDGPEAVGDAVVEALRARQRAGEFDQVRRDGRYLVPRWLKRGARVKVIAGALKGTIGDVWRLTRQGSVAVWVTMMARPTLTELPLDWIARVR